MKRSTLYTLLLIPVLPVALAASVPCWPLFRLAVWLWDRRVEARADEGRRRRILARLRSVTR